MATEAKVKRKDMVTIYGTGQSKHMLAGKKYSVHSIVAEKLFEKGFASRSPVEGGKASKGKKADA